LEHPRQERLERFLPAESKRGNIRTR
jgi:hypothetical protein